MIVRSPSTDTDSQSKRNFRDTRWLLSLGDLMTLLLAVAAVGMTAGTLDSFSSPKGEVPKGRSGVGIVIAPSSNEALSRTIFLYERQFLEEGQRLTGQAAKYLILPKKCEGSCSVSIEVLSCSPDSDSVSPKVWHVSLLRLLTLHRHLFDGKSAIEPESVTMTSLGKHCELLGFAGDSKEEPVMAVRFIESAKKVRNG